MEVELSASRRAYLLSIERFSRIIQEHLEQARTRRDGDEEVQELEQIQLKIMALWKKSIGNIPKGLSGLGAEGHWLQRKPMENPRVEPSDQPAE